MYLKFRQGFCKNRLVWRILMHGSSRPRIVRSLARNQTQDFKSRIVRSTYGFSNELLNWFGDLKWWDLWPICYLNSFRKPAVLVISGFAHSCQPSGRCSIICALVQQLLRPRSYSPWSRLSSSLGLDNPNCFFFKGTACVSSRCIRFKVFSSRFPWVFSMGFVLFFIQKEWIPSVDTGFMKRSNANDTGSNEASWKYFAEVRFHRRGSLRFDPRGALSFSTNDGCQSPSRASWHLSHTLPVALII